MRERRENGRKKPSVIIETITLGRRKRRTSRRNRQRKRRDGKVRSEETYQRE